ncbi:hypothetical protein [Nocardiopsis lambiniae]|uniref:Uncharacterized protein n=1 Tax=Nocardiopsis lambiniae TaxID=3075539 RepID=A0ABU2MC31_9ACTN|nr:hypothetical protein [Nocardiopsis sp. DSM 44743]MDT0330133.1 hypothetical protein [Nocardiopsis sp. DSM 44743]
MAAFVGVAATGAAIARAERQRRAYTPDQVRDRLRERLAQAEASAGPEVGVPEQGESAPGRLRRLLGRVRALAGRIPGRFGRQVDPQG